MPEVYSIKPPVANDEVLVRTISSSSARMSSAHSSVDITTLPTPDAKDKLFILLLNSAVSKITLASLFSTIYCSSVSGRLGARGRATASRAKIASSWTMSN